MGERKLKIISITVVALTLTLFSTSVLTYKQVTGKSTNVITSGDISFEVKGLFNDKDGITSEEIIKIMPGEIISKKANIKNTCTQPFYARMKIEASIDSEINSIDDYFIIDTNTEKWVYVDGWYYYKDIVEPGEVTTDLFNEVKLNGEIIDTEFLGKTLNLVLTADAVQSKNNPVENNETYKALGW